MEIPAASRAMLGSPRIHTKSREQGVRISRRIDKPKKIGAVVLTPDRD